jgi:BirA family biotin operon repressor/biotin-[acetyl-CoA-carboxylase] ligase
MVAQLVVFPVALAVLDFLNGLLKPGMVRVKWPNDLLVDKQKICGALHEIERYQGKTYIVSGIGVNLVDYPKADVSYPATSLREYTNEVPTSLDAAMDIGRRIRGRLNLLSHHGFEMLRAEYLDNAFGYRERISVAFGKERSNVIQGVFTDISAEGALVLATDSGEKKIFTGDVFPDLL